MKKISLIALALLLVLLSGCASLAPKGKTIILNEPVESEEEAPLLSSDFEVKRVVPVTLDKIDPDGLHPDMKRAAGCWKDGERLLVMAVHKSTLPQDVLPEGAVEQPTERVLTQFATLNYQYGFYDPLFTLADMRADCYDISGDGQFMACVAGNTLYVYRMADGSLVTSVTKDVLAPRVAFTADGRCVYFTTSGEQKHLELLEIESGVTKTILDGKSYRLLCGNGESYLLTVVSQGSEEISFYNGSVLQSALLTGKKSGSACQLYDGSALLIYGDDLYHVTFEKAALLQSGVTAFAYDEMTKRIAYAKRSTVGRSDIYVGSYDLTGLSEGRSVYKDLKMDVVNLIFNSDLHKLYAQGADETGSQKGCVIEFN